MVALPTIAVRVLVIITISTIVIIVVTVTAIVVDVIVVILIASVMLICLGVWGAETPSWRGLGCRAPTAGGLRAVAFQQSYPFRFK